MIELVIRLLQPIVKIRREEWHKTILMFLCFSFTIATLYILKPVRSSLFLTIHGAENLRYAYVGEGIFLIFITSLYIKLSRWLKKKSTLFSVTIGFFIFSIIAFWALFKAGYVEWLSYFFYIWVAAYSITIVTQCWALANDIFNPQEAKRLFGFIISGGSLGGIVGGLVTNRFAEKIGTPNLLLLGALLLGCCLFFVQAILKHERIDHAEKAAGKENPSSSTVFIGEKSTWSLFFGSRYLLLIAALVMIAKISSTIIDNQFNAVVESSIIEHNARTAFFGGFMAFLNGVSFFLQLIFSSYALRRFGVGISLLLLPVGLVVGATGTIFLPFLQMAAATKIYDGSLNYSINQLGKEILYLPIPGRVRYRVKPLIDMLAYRVSKSLAGFLIILATPLLGIPDEKLGILVLLLIPLWILSVWGVRDEYMQSIKKLLSHSQIGDKTLGSSLRQVTGILANLEGEKSFETLKAFFAHKSSITRKLSAAACLAFYSSARDMSRVKKLVEEMIRYEALDLKDVEIDHIFSAIELGGSAAKSGGKEELHQATSVFDRYLAEILKAKKDPDRDLMAVLYEKEAEILLKVSECLQNSHEDMTAKRKAILVLTALGTQGAVDILLNSIAAIQDRSLRYNVIAALNRIRSKGGRHQFNKWVIKKEIMNEVKSYQSIKTALEEYKKRKGIIKPEDDYLLATLKAIEEESLERVFRLLALIYESDVIHVIHDRLTEIEVDKHLRANAVELLQNVVDPELYHLLYPVLDEAQWEETPKKKLDQIVEELLESQDRWLTVCALFMIIELNLAKFFPSLEDATHYRTSIVREAAEIAVMKIKSKGINNEV